LGLLPNKIYSSNNLSQLDQIYPINNTLIPFSKYFHNKTIKIVDNNIQYNRFDNNLENNYLWNIKELKRDICSKCKENKNKYCENHPYYCDRG